MDLAKLYGVLSTEFGSQGWWPTRTAGYDSSNKSRDLSEEELFEICIGAILTQNTNWKNVERALDVLFSSSLIDLKALANFGEGKLAVMVKSSGYFRQKAKKLKIFASHVLNERS